MNLLTLETKRLILKGLTPQDMHYIFENLPKSQIKEILGHQSEADYLKEEQKHINGYSSYNRSFLFFLMIDKDSRKIIGRCGLHNWNIDHQRAEIGYNMEDERFKRKGLMGEAVETIIEYGFQELKLNRIEALVGPENVPSLRIIEKNGFTREGVFKQHFNVDEKYEDTIAFALLRQDYKQKTTAK